MAEESFVRWFPVLRIIYLYVGRMLSAEKRISQRETHSESYLLARCGLTNCARCSSFNETSSISLILHFNRIATCGVSS